MAIKAGLVGVNPKGVDKNGMPIGSGGANVEAEIQQINLDIAQLQASKVGVGQLTANNKAFHFAYDSTSEKYGYKLDGTGDFIPFESAGGEGWVTPASLISAELNFIGVEYVSGGYYIDDDTVYVDMVVKIIEAGSRYVEGLPLANSASHLLVVDNNDTEAVASYNNASASFTVTNGTRTAYFYVSPANSEYNHIFGSYNIKED